MPFEKAWTHKLEDRLGSLPLLRQQIHEKKICTILLRLKTDLVSYPIRGGGVEKIHTFDGEDNLLSLTKFGTKPRKEAPSENQTR